MLAMMRDVHELLTCRGLVMLDILVFQRTMVDAANSSHIIAL